MSAPLLCGLRRNLRLVGFAVTVALLLPAGAGAFYGNGAQIVSADFERLEQGDDSTTYAAISADGRYVAIQTRARNFFDDGDADPPGQYRVGGIFRFDLTTKGLEKVADGDLFEEDGGEGAFVRLGASNPSINADGRYVAFSTAEQLVPADVNDHIDVYVRDMAKQIGDGGEYDLVSARDGGDDPAQYGAPEFPLPGSEPGAEASRGVSISADGQKVAFWTAASSDLPASASVPAGQVFLRDRVANTTTLVTAKRDPLAGQMTAEPAGGAFGAALSADGTTVAWTGANAPTQTRFLGGENTDPKFPYYLWRRVADGPSAPTLRITGLADPDDPGCPPDSVTVFNRTSIGPCYGPLTDPEGLLSNITGQLPALSADGRTVAFLTGAGSRPLESFNPGLDLFVTDMTLGPSLMPASSRKATTVELTRDTTGDPATSPPIDTIAMASGGRYLAVTTVRTQFALPALRLLGQARSIPDVRELYVVDLKERTLERVPRSFQGGDVDADVQNGVSISADGERVAFTSFAGNLFFGDANKRADAFVAEREAEPGAGVPAGLPAGGGDATIETSGGGPRIVVKARSRPGGRIELTVSVPAAGGIKAVATAQAGSPRKRRTLGVAKARAEGGTRSGVRMSLTPVWRYREELRARGAIPGRVAVAYVASRGGRRAAASVRVTFRQLVGPGGSSNRGAKVNDWQPVRDDLVSRLRSSCNCKVEVL
jgi:hypothetical protein